MAESLDRMIKTRAPIRTLVTKLLNKIEKDLADRPEDTNGLQESLVQLKLKEERLSTLDAAIEKITAVADLENEITLAEEYREKIVLWKTRIERRLQAPSGNNSSRTSNANGNSGNMTIQLPRLNLCKFSGNVSDWQSFWSQFEGAIHDNDSLSSVDKFNYLKSFLDGPAVAAISGLPLTEANYKEAVQILKERYGRRDLLISAHMHNLLSIASVGKPTDLSALRKMYDSCEIQIRSLETMGVTSDSYGTLLCPILLKRIPKEMALEFSRSKEDKNDWSVKDLLQFLRKEIESREHANFLTSTDDSIFSNNKNSNSHLTAIRKNKQNTLTSAAALTAAVETNCLFCNDNAHRTDSCSKSVEEKRNILQNQKRCFVCLKQFHIGRFCRSKIRCRHCNKKHHHTLCIESLSNNTVKQVVPETTVVASVTQVPKNPQIVYLQTISCNIQGMSERLKVRVLFDGGSQRSFICENVSRKLKLKVLGSETLNIHAFGQMEPKKSTHRRVVVPLQNSRCLNETIYIEALETPAISSALVQIPSNLLLSRFNVEELQLSEEPEQNNLNLTVLIGTDYFWKIVTGNIRRLGDSLVSLETKLGWSIHGPIPVQVSSEICNDTSVLKVMTSYDDEEELVSAQIKKFWELDSLGITTDSLNETECKNAAVQLFEDGIQYHKDRYTVRLPWKPGMKEQLPNNYDLAKGRLKGLSLRLVRNPVLRSQYDDILNEYLEKGIIEKVDKTLPANVEHYLPHTSVLRPDKTTTKVRIVFDASARQEGGLSLNDCLYPGPNLNPELLALLLRFRQNKIAFVADIEKAFLQVGLNPEDRDVTRFLWCNVSVTKSTEREFQTFRFTRILFGVTSSPFLLSAVIRHHAVKYKDEHPETCQLMEESFYVDDLIGGADSVDEAHQRSTECAKIMQAAGMPMRKWQTNSPELLDKWKTENLDCVTGIDSIMPFCSTQMKVLGLAWDPQKDQFYFDVNSLLRFLLKRKDTKRFLLQAAGRIFDPLGFLTPYVIRVKCIFQELWTAGINWDEQLPDETCKKWLAWCNELTDIPNIRIPRFCLPGIVLQNKSIEYHCFCDASERAYAAVIYARYVRENDGIDCSLVCAKSRVSPLKKLSVARLELMAALLGARLAATVTNCLKVKTTVKFWTDSQITYYWITGDPRRYKPFVQNRISEIHALSDPINWSHCPGQSNPADLPTRGRKINDLANEKLWWNGPEWLQKAEKYWPTKMKSSEYYCKIDDDKETRENNTIQCSIINGASTSVFDINNYSSLRKVIRVTAWIFRFVSNARKNTNKREGFLRFDELKNAEIYWARKGQDEAYGTEIRILSTGAKLHTDSKLLSLNPFLDKNGLLRVGGRIQNSEFSFAQKHPIIIPGESSFTSLLIEETHKRVMHCGVSSTLAQVRQSYWIPRGRQVVKRILQKCAVCRKYSATPYTEEMSPLPKERVTEMPSFTVTGLDYLGPIITRVPGGTEKSYVALFTCAVTRAVHLELVTDLSTDKFLMALRRFLARRGNCSIIYSDNASTFKRAEKEISAIQKIAREQKIQDFMASGGIVWKNIIPRAPWFGGFWERLVRSIKTCLRKTLGKSLLNFEELATILSEVEAILNSRPISYTYNEASEPEPLTPSQFLTGRTTLLSPPDFKYTEPQTPNKEMLTKRKRYRQELLNKTWKKWRQQYLLDLRSAHQSATVKKGPSIKENDVVLLNDEKRPKLLWKLGIVSALHTGRDGKVRSCTLKLGDGTQVKRPVQLLSPLELHCSP